MYKLEEEAKFLVKGFVDKGARNKDLIGDGKSCGRVENVTGYLEKVKCRSPKVSVVLPGCREIVRKGSKDLRQGKRE